MRRNVLFLVVLVGILALTGCTRYENYSAGTVLNIEDSGSGVVEVEDVSVKTKINDQLEITEYIIGSGDVLSVYTHDDGFRIGGEGIGLHGLREKILGLGQIDLFCFRCRCKFFFVTPAEHDGGGDEEHH